MRIPFAVNSYTSRAKAASMQRLVNWYPEIEPGDAKSRLLLFGTPGATLFADTLDTGAVKATIVHNGAMYVAAGTTVYKVTTAGVVSTIGTIASASRVTMAANRTQVVVCAEPSAYVINASDVMAEITDADFPGASSFVSLDSYGIFTQPNSDTWGLTSLADFTSVDALDFATAESQPDKIVTAYVDHRELWLFGEKSIEIWYNAGSADFPFSRVSGAYIERGCAAAGSVAQLDNSVVWLADNRVIYRAQGYAALRISTHAIEEELRKYSSVSDAIGFGYSQAGHEFYVLTFPTAGACWVYDAATQLWHERASHGLSRYRWNCAEIFSGRVIVGDSQAGKLYVLDPDTYTEAGSTIRSVAMSPPVHAQGKRGIAHDLEVEFEAGVGLSTGQGSDPQAMLRWTDDDGVSWSPEYWRPIGKIGKTRDRAIWTRLGSFYNRTYELSISDPVKRTLIAADPYLTSAED